MNRGAEGLNPQCRDPGKRVFSNQAPVSSKQKSPALLEWGFFVSSQCYFSSTLNDWSQGVQKGKDAKIFCGKRLRRTSEYVEGVFGEKAQQVCLFQHTVSGLRWLWR